MTSNDADRFPARLRASAVPRWSHRDPVEVGNPFDEGDPRHVLWSQVSQRARAALLEHDRALAAEPTNPDPYSVRLVDLAVARFDTWALRSLAVVTSADGLSDFETWLDDYQRNWLSYVADTCPHVDVQEALATRLTQRVSYWVGRAQANHP